LTPDCDFDLLADLILRFIDRPIELMFRADRGRFLLELRLSGIGDACNYFLSALEDADFSKHTPKVLYYPAPPPLFIDLSSKV